MSHIFVNEQKVLLTANRLATRYIAQEPLFDIFTELNAVFLEATHSDYGFVARVFKNESGPYIKTLALSNIAWNEETRRLYSENAERGMVFENLDTLFGQVLKTGKAYISNDARNDPNAGGIPVGHPNLERFMGIPIVRDDILIGMVGLANGQNYCVQQLNELNPILQTTAQVIYSIGQQSELVADGNYFFQPQAVINSIKSGVMTVDSNGKIVSANLSAEYIFGFQFGELMDTSIQSLIPPTGSDEIYSGNADFCLDKSLMGHPFEATGASKAGNYFPIEVTCGILEENSFSFVVRDLTEEKKSERLKSEFISTVSHELRTPLTAVYTALSMLSSKEIRPEDPQEIEDLTSIAQRNCERLVNLVGDILDFEKLNCGKSDFEFRKTSLLTVFNNAKEVTQILANLKDVELCFDFPLPDLEVAVDCDRMSQVLVNLISNAIKYSLPDQRVKIGFETAESDDLVRVFVQDQGPGISPEDLRKVFDPFVQIDKSSSGTGLGLAICKQIVEEHECQIRGEAVLGEGSKFSFELFRYAELNSHLGRKTECDEVLWIERDIQHFEHAVSGMRNHGVKFHCVANAQLAKRILNAHSIGLLVVEYPIALDSHAELLRQIRESLRYKDCPIIVYSNDLQPDVRGRLEALNIDCELKKSWKFENLRSRVMSKLGLASS